MRNAAITALLTSPTKGQALRRSYPALYRDLSSMHLSMAVRADVAHVGGVIIIRNSPT